MSFSKLLGLSRRTGLTCLTSRQIASYEGPSYEAVRAIRGTNLSPAMLTYYREPLLIHSGRMQYLYDHQGQEYLDMFGGIVTVSVGHCHPKVNEALVKQVNTLWHTTNIYLHPGVHEYAVKLVETLPDPLSVVYFVNSGSEANDLAMYMARLHTGNYDLISFRNAYHGMSPYTMGVTAHSTWKFPVVGGGGIHHTMNPDMYRGLWGGPGYRQVVHLDVATPAIFNLIPCMEANYPFAIKNQRGESKVLPLIGVILR